MISAHFARSEFACKCGCGQDTVDTELLVILEAVRQHFGQPVTINSGNRCPAYNKHIDGRPRSKHLTGRAADIRVRHVTPQKVQAYISTTWPDSFGMGAYDTFTHVDSRSSKARW